MICNHAAMKGVCDTPLHMFDNFMGNMISERSKTKQCHPTHHHRLMCTFAAMEGVCDTPLHMFDQFTGKMMVEWE